MPFTRDSNEPDTMSRLSHFSGRNRVVIDAMRPMLDGGAFPVKRRLSDTVDVEAHVLADSHAHLDVVLSYRKYGESWEEVPMRDVGNDVFCGAFHPASIGVHVFRVIGWIDAFRNWHVGFVKKTAAGDPDIAVELLIGAKLVEAAAGRAADGEAAQLYDWAIILRDASRDLGQRVQLASSSDFYALVSAYPDRSLQTIGAEQEVWVERDEAYFSTWYEYFPRSCGPVGQHGTFRDAAGRLPEIARMGFNIVYFPPIHPIGRTFRKGKNNSLTAADGDVGSPWAIGSEEGGHTAIHPELGTVEDFQWFLGKAAEQGLEVALDIAFQCSPDHPYVRSHPEWFQWRPDGSVQYAENPPKKYQDILPIHFETLDWEALWEELKGVFEYWIEVGVTVFRVDNPHTKPMEFWRWCLREIKLKHPEVIFLSEAFTRPKRKYRLAKAGFTQGYTYFTWRNHPAEMRAYLEELTSDPVRQFFLPNFWPNTPDILHEDLQRGNRATFMGRYILAATLSGNLGIYGPAFELLEHEPFPGKEEYNHNEKYELKNWDWDRPGNIKSEIARVNEIRRGHRAMQGMEGLVFVATDNPHVLAYIRQTADRADQLLVIVNFDWHHTQTGFVELPLLELGIGSDKSFSVKDLYDPSMPCYEWRGSRNFFKLDPSKAPAHIFQLLR
ncbi:MAG: Alpha,4-glucan:maltose-phosphate maltosyltransferase [Verrucomicrobiota bacterium]